MISQSSERHIEKNEKLRSDKSSKIVFSPDKVWIKVCYFKLKALQKPTK